MRYARFLALGSVPLAFGAGSVALHLWRLRAPAALGGDLAQPLPVATAWHGYGTGGFAILTATILAATAGLVLSLHRFARDGEAGDGLPIVILAGLSLAAAGSWTVVFSSDVYAYAAYGALVLGGHDPYAAVPAGLHGPFVDAARYQWSGPFPRCVYGPVFVALAGAGVAAWQPAGVAATLAALRLATALCFLAGVALLHAALRGLPPGPRWVAVCAYGLNPVALWTVAEGHNDALLMLPVLAGAWLAVRGGRLAGALLVGLSPLLKAPGVLLAALAAAGAVAFRRPGRRVTLLGLGAGTLGAAALVLPPLEPALTSLDVHGRYAPEVSAQGLLGLVPSLVLAAAATLYALDLLRRRRRTGFGWAGIAVLLALPNPYPWYAPWLLPLALAAGLEPAGIALWAATISSVARYLPDVAGNLDPGTARLASLAAASPMLWALAGTFGPASAGKKALAQP